MKNWFQKKTIEGLDMTNDFLNWISTLEQIQREDIVWPENAAILKLGPVCFARVAMAAVEQYAINKKLNPGTIERLRYFALNLFLSASTTHAFFDGITAALADLRKNRPENVDWVDMTWHEAGRSYGVNWRKSASLALSILVEIRDQNSRRGQRGNPGRPGTHPMKSPEAVFLDYIDADILKTACDNTPPLQRSDRQSIRANIRPLVRNVMAIGLLGYDPQEKDFGSALDTHTRRVQRKFDAMTSDQQVKLASPSNA